MIIKSSNVNDIRPLNNKGQRHGYWKVHKNSGKLLWQGNYVNHLQEGLWNIYWVTMTHEKLYFIR